MALQREVVVRTALALLDEVGLDGLTMRRLAAELGVQNPALYWHFKNKQDLLNQMAETMLAEAYANVTLPDANTPWDEWLIGLARMFRGALLSHRDGSRVIVEADLSQSPMQVGFDLALGVLREAGFRSSDALIGLITIFDYTTGATFEEQGDPRAEVGTTEADASVSGQLRSVLDAGRLPNLAAALEEHVRERPGNRRADGFEAGVRLILAGMALKLRQNERNAKTPGTPRRMGLSAEGAEDGAEDAEEERLNHRAHRDHRGGDEKGRMSRQDAKDAKREVRMTTDS
jgi:TetR/AcrR family tetracycline transcriptional repressor